MKDQFEEDMKIVSEEGKCRPVSLLGKWLKSENTSSKQSVKLAKLTKVL